MPTLGTPMPISSQPYGRSIAPPLSVKRPTCGASKNGCGRTCWVTCRGIPPSRSWIASRCRSANSRERIAVAVSGARRRSARIRWCARPSMACASTCGGSGQASLPASVSWRPISMNIGRHSCLGRAHDRHSGWRPQLLVARGDCRVAASWGRAAGALSQRQTGSAPTMERSVESHALPHRYRLWPTGRPLRGQARLGA